MLKGISPVISPDLLKVMAEMGHGDEIVLADAHFPGHALNERVIRADGISITALLDGMLPLFELDAYDDPLVMMAPVEGDTLDPDVERSYMQVIQDHVPGVLPPVRLERYQFYEFAAGAYAVVVTGEKRKYGNIMLRKGVTP